MVLHELPGIINCILMRVSAVKCMVKYFTAHNTECKEFRELVHNSKNLTHTFVRKM